MKTKVVLMRHAHVMRQKNGKGQELIYGHAAPLSFLGSAEMARLASSLGDIQFDILYTSPNLRAKSSTEHLIKNLVNKPKVVEDNINLRSVDCPSWVGKPIDESVGNNGFFASSNKTLGDETFEEFDQRIWDEFRKIVEENEGRTIGIMGHSEGIGLIMHRLHNPHSTTPQIEGAIPTGTAVKFDIDPTTFEIENETSIPERHFRGKEVR